MLIAQSCIVAEPPGYRAPGQTRPVLNAYAAVPTATRALAVFTSEKVATRFTVQVRSEDAGEDLKAVFFLDYQLPGESRLVNQKITASTYDNEGRNIRYDWYPQVKDKAGCHFMSLVVAHDTSFQDMDQDHLKPAAAEQDASIITWVVNIDPPLDAVNTLANCPSRAAVAP